MLAIGMDVHSSMSAAYAVATDPMDAAERDMAEGLNRSFKKFPSNYSGMKKLSDYLDGYEHCILIENSTKTHEVFWILNDLECNVMVAYSADLYRITKSVKKTDSHDSMELAHYMRRRINGEIEFSECLMVDRKWMNRRQLCRIYVQESEELSNTRRQIRSCMLLRGIKLESASRDIVSKRAISELKNNDDLALKLLISRAEDMLKRRNVILKMIKDEFGDDEYFNILITIPGFGPISAAYFSSMIVDIDRFNKISEFSAYFGIVPKQMESAGIEHAKGITRRGDERARNLLTQTTFVHIYNDRDRESSISRMYDRLLSRGFPHKKAITACANKMTKVVYGMLKRGESYRF